MKTLHHGTVKNGKPIFDNRSNFVKAFYSMEGGMFTVSVSKYTKQRSNGQNRYLHGVLYTILRDITGHTTDELHEVLKDMFAPKIEVLGCVIPKSTSNFTTVEFEDYTQDIRAWAADNGWFLPLPNEAEQ